MLLFDQLQYDNPSLEQHSMGFDGFEHKKISKEGLNKRFNTKAVSFVEKIMCRYWQQSIHHEAISTPLLTSFTSIRILDSTEFKLPDSLADVFPGYSSESARSCASIQFEYDILKKDVCNVTLGNARQSDKTYADTWMHNIKEGELILRDLGYYGIGSYKAIEDKKASYISRLKSCVKMYEKKAEQYIELNLKTLIQRIRRAPGACFDQMVYIGTEAKKEVRLMAWLLDEAAQRKRVGKKKAKKGKVTERDVLWSMLNVFITNISADELSCWQTYDLYKIRWQVELVFKTWKSVLKLHVVRKMKADRLKCYIYSKLLWILLCWDITALSEPLLWSKHEKLLSLYKSFSILKHNAIGIKDTLFHVNETLKKWLTKMIDYFAEYGRKETKKGRKNIADILRYQPFIY